METKTVLVTGIGGNVGQGILRNINASFPEIKLIGTDIAEFTAGNYLCDKTYQTPYAYKENFLSILKEIIKNENVDLIIPSTDYEVYYLSLHKKELNCVIAANDAEIAKIYLDKYETYLYHKQNNIPFAKTWLPSEYFGDEKNIIAKPREGRGSRGIIINPKNIKSLSEDYIIQPLYKGKEITTAVYVTKKKELHGIFSMERELSNGTTKRCKVCTDYDNHFSEIALKLMEKTGIVGSFNIQSIVTASNEIVPFEINCRISGTNSIRHNLGFQDVKYTIQEYLYNIEPEKPQAKKGIATRILLDVIYPDAIDENLLNNKNSNPIIY